MDKNFLKRLFAQQQQQKFARLTTLTWDEQAIESIEGRITSGSVNIDGNSGMRRTCSLNMVTPRLDINNYTIALKTKVKLEVGLTNTIDSSYPNIIWFKQGIFIATNFNTSVSTNNTSVSFSGKDKACLLNGEVSGTFPHVTDVGAEEMIEDVYTQVVDFTYAPGVYYYEDNDEYVIDYGYKKSSDRIYYQKQTIRNIEKLSIDSIIKNIVHVFGNEPLENIIVNDLSLYGLELLTYRGTEPMYLITYDAVNDNIYQQITLDGTYACTKNGVSTTLAELNYSNGKAEGVRLSNSTQVYTIQKVEFGESIGYHPTKLVYVGDLIANAGETVISVLDKLKAMLVNFEYFYDVDGRFIFQARHDYQAVDFTSFVTDGDNDIYILPSGYNNKTLWEFDDLKTIMNISHTPNLLNLRNDYSIHGERTSANGSKSLIHLRYAIETKPLRYRTIDIAGSSRSNITYVYEPGYSGNINNLLHSYKAYQDRLEKLRTKKAEYPREVDGLEVALEKINDIMTDSRKYIKDSTKAIINAREEAFKASLDRLEKLDGVIIADKYSHTKSWYTKLKTEYVQLLNKLQLKILAIHENMFAYIQNNPYKFISDDDSAEYTFRNEVLRQAYIKYGDPNVSNSNNKGLLGNIWEVFCNNALWKHIYNGTIRVGDNHDSEYYAAYHKLMTTSETVLKNLQTSYNVSITNHAWYDAISYAVALTYLQIIRLYLQIFARIDIEDTTNNAEDTTEQGGASIEPTYKKIGVMYNQGDKNYSQKYYTMIRAKDTNFNNGASFLLFPSQAVFWDRAIFYRNYTPGGNYDTNSYMALIGFNFQSSNSCYDEISEQQHKKLPEAWDYYGRQVNKAFDTYKETYEQVNSDIKIEGSEVHVDWRELIYQMATDYYDYAHNSDVDYITLLKQANPEYINGKTGYEVFYTDILSFWRELYFNPILEPITYKLPDGHDISEYQDNGWNIVVTDDVDKLNYWIDLSEGEQFANYRISQIGDRLKTVTNNSTSTIIYTDVPNILYYRPDDKAIKESVENSGDQSYAIMVLGKTLDNIVSLSSQGRSAIEVLQENLYKYLYCTESISLTALPIYTLEPNYRISVNTDIVGLSGEYIINRITMPLAYNGTMQLSCTKAVPYIGIYGEG